MYRANPQSSRGPRLSTLLEEEDHESATQSEISAMVEDDEESESHDINKPQDIGMSEPDLSRNSDDDEYDPSMPLTSENN